MNNPQLNSILLLTMLIITTQSAYFQTLQNQFNELRLKSILDVIPQTNTQSKPQSQQQGKQPIIEQLFDIQPVDLAAQLKAYEQRYNYYLSVVGDKLQQKKQQKKWRPDPQLSSSFDLHNGNRVYSFIVKGQQLSKLIIDLTVTSSDPLDTKHDGVILAIINLSEISNSLQGIVEQDWFKALKQTINNYTQYKTQVRKHNFAVIPSFTSDIYEIVIFKHGSIGENFTDVHVSLQIKIQNDQFVNDINNQAKTLSPEEEQQMVKNMKTIAELNQITFLDSLQLWQKIETHRKQNQAILEWNSSVEYYECLGMVLLYVIQYGIFIFITKSQSVV